MPCFFTEKNSGETNPVLTDRNFALPGDTPHFPPDRPVDTRHIALNITVDFSAKALRGTCDITLSALFEEVQTIKLQAAEMTITSVHITGKQWPKPVALQFDYDGENLFIELDTPLKYGSECALSITYATHPRIGMNFVGPNAGDPDRAVQAHTQGQPEYAHYWFPCHDSPNDRATMSVAAQVPDTFFAVSNGRLEKVETDTNNHTKTFYYHESVPFPAYIATLAVGEFTELRDEFGETPVLYYVRPGFEEHAKRMMGDTPKMLAYYSEHFGIRYPYEKYAQVILEEFTGAMENTSATSHTWLLLPDEKSFIDWEGKATVAHELVHQWFGDLLTCRDWSHAWLNESFATYFEETWKQADPTAGELEFRLGMKANQRFYLDEDSSYRRPIVYNVYERDGQELFDRHLYEKGSCVLHMLRYITGEAAFWRAIQYYAQRNRGREVITADLERAFEESAGKSLGQFFNQWVYHGGHPELDVSYTWDGDAKLAKVTIKQTQKPDTLTLLFNTPIDIAFTFDHKGKTETKIQQITISQTSETFVFPLEKRPVAVRLDPYGWILKTVTFDRPVTMLRWQLQQDTDPMGRLEAAEALAKFDDSVTIAALSEALQQDDFWAVRSACASSLAKIKSQTALNALLAAAKSEKHPKALRSVVAALGAFKAPERANEAKAAAEALEHIIKHGAKSYQVEAEAAISLGKTRVPQAQAILSKHTGASGWQEIVSKGAMLGLAKLGTPEAAEVLTGILTDPSKPMLQRDGAAMALRSLLAEDKIAADSAAHIAIREALVMALDDPWVRARTFAALALLQLNDPATIPALENHITRELESRPRRYMRQAVLAIRAGNKTEAESKKLRKDVEELREDNRKLRERITILEARFPSEKAETE